MELQHKQKILQCIINYLEVFVVEIIFNVWTKKKTMNFCEFPIVQTFESWTSENFSD